MGKRFGSRARYSRRVIKNFLRVKRTFYAGSWTFSNASTNGFWRYFTHTLGALPSASEFSSVFDEYRIRAIKVTFRPNTDAISGQLNDVSTATSLANLVHNLHTCIDPMSTVLPSGTYSSSTLNSFLENSGVRSRRFNKALSVYYRPQLLDAVQGTGTAVGKVSPKKWLRTSDTAAEYRGFHAFWQTSQFLASATSLPWLDIFVTYYMEFKNVR